MSALLRPNGNELAAEVSGNISLHTDQNEAKEIKRGEKLEILCDDGHHHQAEVRSISKYGRLSIRFGNGDDSDDDNNNNDLKRRICSEPLASLYIARAGTFAVISHESARESAKEASKKPGKKGRPRKEHKEEYKEEKKDDDCNENSKQIQRSERGEYFLPSENGEIRNKRYDDHVRRNTESAENRERRNKRYDDRVRRNTESAEVDRRKSNVTKESGGDNHQEKRRKVPSVVSSPDSIKSGGQKR